MNTYMFEKLSVSIHTTREEMGKFAAQEAIQCLKNLLSQKDEVNCVFAAAPSQNEFLQELCSAKDLAWEKVNAFHMDEYIGIEAGAPQSFSGFLSNAIFNALPFKSVNLLNGMNNPQEEQTRYSKLLQENPVDVVFMGIGENGHIAFNDPGVADFKDTQSVKVVELEESCKQQQVNDGCFKTLQDVPTHALTLTIPALLAAPHVFCMVPNSRKAPAVKACLQGDITEQWPASILRTKEQAKLYLDNDSASQLSL